MTALDSSASNAALRGIYGAESETRFCINWRVFFMAAEDLWGFRRGNDRPAPSPLRESDEPRLSVEAAFGRSDSGASMRATDRSGVMHADEKTVEPSALRADR